MYEAGLEIQEVTESSTGTGPHAIILTAKQSSSLLHHPLRLKDRLCRHSVNTDLSPLHPNITQSVIHGEQSQTVKFNLLKLSASSPLDLNVSKYLYGFWTASFKTNWFHEREQRKEDHCDCPMPSAQPSWWAKVTHCSLTVSFQGSLSLLCIQPETASSKGRDFIHSVLAQVWHTEGEPQVVVQRTVISFYHQTGGRARTSACGPSPAEGDGVCRLTWASDGLPG